jgi:c-di-GMP-binding flagellar brake protein YcgR
VIEIEIKLGLFAGQYRSRILDFGSKYIKLMVPKVANEDKHIWQGTTVHINYMRPDAMYTFKVRVRKGEVYPRPLLLVDIPPQVERVQRRRYVRVDTPNMKISFRTFVEDVAYADNEEPFAVAKLFNISAGGLRFDSDDIQVPKGEIVELELLLEGYKFQHVLGEVVRSIELKKRNRSGDEIPFYSHGINFIQIHRVQKEKIFSYVFKREREMISSGTK